MSMRRREFFGKALAGTAGIVVGGSLARAAETVAPAPAAKDPYAYVPLGKTKLAASRVGIGLGMRGGGRASNQVRLGREGYERLLRHAYDRGVRFFDHADLYGSHAFFPGTMKGIPRDTYTISTKIWWRPGGIPEAERPDADVVVERFRKELGTEYLDIVQLHCVTDENWPAELRKQMDILDGLKQKGFIRAHGVSCHGLAPLRAAAKEPWVDVVHARINPFAMSMDGPVDQVVPILREIHDAGKGIVGMKIIGEGRLRNDDERKDESVRFAMGLGAVDAMIVGFEKTDEVDDFETRVRKVLGA
ncbi:MAG: aldo/keto reductase [Planctomycetes bacterium]|nr:aldo/keto reductase [Planctomycetota bacterium]